MTINLSDLCIRLLILGLIFLGPATFIAAMAWFYPFRFAKLSTPTPSDSKVQNKKTNVKLKWTVNHINTSLVTYRARMKKLCFRIAQSDWPDGLSFITHVGTEYSCWFRAHFDSLEDAKEACQTFADNLSDESDGRIYFDK